MTLTPPTLFDSREVIVVHQGEAKRSAFDRAAADGPVADMPLRAVLRQARARSPSASPDRERRTQPGVREC